MAEEAVTINVPSAGAVNVKTQGYPGFPTDLQQPLSAVLTVAKGVSEVTETIFERRFRFLEELRRESGQYEMSDFDLMELLKLDRKALEKPPDWNQPRQLMLFGEFVQ